MSRMRNTIAAKKPTPIRKAGRRRNAEPAGWSVLRAELDTSPPAAVRLYEAVAAGTNEFVLTSHDGAVAAHVRLRLSDLATTHHEIGGRAFRVDWSTAALERQGRTASLSRTEIRLLAVLLAEQGGVLSRSELIERVWPQGELLGSERESALNVYICCLRKRLAAIGVHRGIETVRGAGYRLLP